MSVNTIRELFAHNCWGNGVLYAVALKLSGEQLDRPFEMGEGSLRATFRHIYGAERNWYERVQAPGSGAFPRATGLSDINELHDAGERLAEARAAWLGALTRHDLERSHTYTLSTGATYTSRLDDILLHVCNHGTHHRAQTINMLRRVGAPGQRYGADYIYMHVENPDRPTPPLETDALQQYFAYGDWAFRQVWNSAAGLKDEQLDRPFEMGMGSLRKTLIHIHDAEHWWQGSWRNGPVETFPALDGSLSLARLQELFERTAAQRNEYLAARTDAALTESITALVRPDRKRSFPLGVTMLQLCSHGTHHRAQALNMLRHLGAPVPELDWIDWTFAA